MPKPKNEWERGQLRHYREAQRRCELYDAAHAALTGDPKKLTDLAQILDKWAETNKWDRQTIEHYERDQRAAEEAERRIEKAKADAQPYDGPAIKCEVEVGRDQGRWTSFGRCDKGAKWVVEAKPMWGKDESITLAVCTIHRDSAAKGYGLKRWEDR